MSATVSVQLLDPTQAYPVQIWEFPMGADIFLGRGSDNDVQIGDPYVSRTHAAIKLQGDEWGLHVLSQNGVILDGKKIRYATLSDNTIFQLSARGPYLKFMCADDVIPELTSQDTVSFDADAFLILNLDTEQRDREVEQIVESPFFERLQKMAEQMRNKHRPNPQ